MKEVAERIEVSARHIGLVDDLFRSLDQRYSEERRLLDAIPGYQSIQRQLYWGQKGRQMMLGDLLLYILTGRGYWTAVSSPQEFADFVRVVMRTVNLLYLQETLLFSKTEVRKKFLSELEAAEIPDFHVSATEEARYAQLKELEGLLTPGNRSLYPVADSLVPRSLGAAVELLAYVYLLKRRIGYIVPLLFAQRLFNGPKHFAPPDYILLRPEAHVIGIEVGAGMGQFSLRPGKVDQVNEFVQETGIPTVTAVVPHALYRCPICEEWITWCEQVIEESATTWTGEQESISCPSCPLFANGNCRDIIYNGRLSPGTKPLHYHYQCVRDRDYVQSTGLGDDGARARRLIHYFPVVSGLERLVPV